MARRPRRRRLASLVLAVVAASTVAWVGDASAADDERGNPWAKGTIRPSVGLGFGYSPELVTLRFGVGASYFVANGFSLGLHLDDEVLIYSKQFKSDFPGIEDQLPTNAFRMTPIAQWVFFRRPRFSPYVFGGVGPVFFNHDNGVVGHWVAGPGAYISIAGPVYLDVGVAFSGMFPAGKCNNAFEYSAPSGNLVQAEVNGYCQFGWGPRLGIVISFGKRSKKKQPEPQRRPAPQFREPPDPFEPEPKPAEPQPYGPEAEPTDVAAPVDPSGDAPPAEAPPITDAPPTDPDPPNPEGPAEPPPAPEADAPAEPAAPEADPPPEPEAPVEPAG